MWNIIKSIFRYSLKNKVALITLTFLTFLSTGVFASLLTLSDNLSNAYKKLVNDGNLNNATIHELYSTTVDGRPDITGDAAKVENKRLFLNELSNLIGADNYRRFNSIDFNTTNSGFAYKIVQNDPDYTIDKLVIYDGSNALDMTYNFDEIVANATWAIETPVAAKSRWLLVYLASRATWTDETTAIAMQNAFNLIKDRPNADPKSELASPTKEYLQQWTDAGYANYSPLVDKQYRLGFNIKGLVPITGIFDNFSSYSSVVPTYILEKHKLSVLPDNYLSEYKAMNDENSMTTNKDFEKWLNAVPSNYKIKIDNIEYLIVGSGLAPSFMYPVYSFDKAIPNTSTEIFLFSNQGGFQLAYDSNRSSPTDDYLIAKIDNLSQSHLDSINSLSKKYMSWPSNINAAYFSNDTKNLLIPAPIRVSFLPNLVDMQIGLSNGLSFFIGALNCIVFIFSIRKFIEDNRDSLAILRANGIKKRTIVASTSFFGMFPSFVGGTLGFMLAQFTQNPFLSLYAQYWVVPTAISVFNPFMFFGVILVPFILMAGLSTLLSFMLLRKNASKLMSDNGKFKITPVGKVVGNIFAKADIITRFRASIAFSSLPKLFAITTLFTLVASALTFSVSITNKFTEAKTATFGAKNYNFALDLTTPTVQGGQYFAVTSENLGKTIIDDQGEVLNFNTGMPDDGQLITADYINLKNYDTGNMKFYNGANTLNPNFMSAMTATDPSSQINALGSLSGIHFPTLSDSTFQTGDLLYLKNRIQSPFTVDLKVGVKFQNPPLPPNPLPSIQTNAWDIARSLAPPNVMLNADKLNHQLWTQIINDEAVYFNEEYINTYINSTVISTINKNDYLNKPFNSIFVAKNYIKYLTDQPVNVDSTNYNYIYKQNTSDAGQAGWYEIAKDNLAVAALKNDFLVLSAHVYTSPQYQSNIFSNTYNTIIVEPEDETFTRVEADLLLENGDESITMKGIKPDSKFVDLITPKNERINNKLWLVEGVESDYKDEIHHAYEDILVFDNPENNKVIINESAAYQYKLDIGSKITIHPKNTATRFNPNIIGNADTQNFDQYNNRTFELEVIDIVSSYQYPEFYMNQRLANHINAMDYQTILDTSFTTEYVYDPITNRNIGISAKQIDPFNGIFSLSDNPKSIANSAPLYSESGLAPGADKFTKSSLIIGVLKETLDAKFSTATAAKNQYAYIAKMQLARTMGYTDQDGVVNMDDFEAVYVDSSKVDQLYDDLIEIYGVNPLLSIIYNVEYVNMFMQLFDNLSSFVNSIVALILAILLSISILSVIFLSVEFISSAISVIAILKALGFYDNANAFAFLSMFFPAIIIAIAISVPISIALISLMKGFIYGFGSILLPIAYQWWYFVIPLILLFALLGITIAAAIIMLKKQDITRAITR